MVNIEQLSQEMNEMKEKFNALIDRLDDSEIKVIARFDDLEINIEEHTEEEDNDLI